jgi:peptidoglycan hydrolase CwlO-like protein
MKLTIGLILSIISCIICVCTFVLNRKDKSTKDSGNNSYRQGQIDMQLKNILNKLEKIEKKLDDYDREIDEKIEIALEHHIKEMHPKEV